MAQRLAPDALLTQTNLTGAVTAIQDDPDAPDASWLTATSTTAASICRVSFPTPSPYAPKVGAGLQEFRVWVRKTSGSGTPTTTIELWEGGVLKSTLLAATNITSTTGQLLSATWNSSSLTASDGSGVEVQLTGTVGGSGGNRATMEVGAIEWNVATVAQDLAGSSAGATTVSGALTVTHDLAGSSAGASTVMAALSKVWNLVGSSAGTATVAGDISVIHDLVGSSAGVTTVTGVLDFFHPIDRVAIGSAALGTIALARDLAVSPVTAQEVWGAVLI